MLKKSSILAVFIILIVGLWLCKPLFVSGFYNIHDNQSVGRLYELDLAIKSGHFPPRWSANLGFGYGYPLFVFYPPLAYYCGEIWHLLGWGYLDATKIVYGLSLILSGFTMYWWARNRLSSLNSMIVSLFYMMAPYRAVDLYVRGALAECFSFVLLPLVFKFTDDLFRHKKWSSIFGGICLGLLVITHNLITVQLFILWTVYIGIGVIFLLVSRKKRENWSYVLSNWLIMIFVGMGLSAFFWIPSLSLKSSTIVDQILLQNRYDFRLHFVALKQLWNSAWGFGGSELGLLDGLSFKIGKIHILSVLASLMAMIFIKKARHPYVIKIIILFVIASWLTTESSSLVWENLKPMQYIQFPWRFLAFSVLFSSLASGYLLQMISKLNRWLYLLGVLILLYGLGKPNLKLFNPQHYLDVTDSDFISQKALRWNNSSSSFEFIPRGVKLVYDSDRVETLKTLINANNFPTERISPKDQNLLRTDILVNKPHRLVFNYDISETKNLTLNMFNFPGWRLWFDGKIHNFDTQMNNQLINLSLVAGEHQVEVRFTQGGVMALGNYLSLFTLIMLVLTVVKSKWNKGTIYD
jgi:hypothetical protein